MSKFNSYARKVNDIATAAFEEYRKTEAAYKKAEEQARQYPPRHGMVDAQYAAKSARAQADFLEAKEAYSKAKRVLESHKSELAAIRKELAAELEDAYSVDPAKLDTATLELLKSGILTGNEYVKLMREAQAAGNPTMVRMIGKYAEDAAAARGEKYGQNDEQARTMRLVGHESRQNTGSEHLKAFDYMADIYNRAVNNPGMIDHWGELTAETVENF